MDAEQTKGTIIMQCQRCNKKKATVYYRESLGGYSKALRLCGDCAEILERAGELEEMSTPLSGIRAPFLYGDGESFPLPLRPSSPCGGTSTPTCSRCGTAFSDLSESGRVGCALCYTVFAEELADTVRAALGQGEHRGRVSAGFRAGRERLARLAALREDLKAAVGAEEFERAAALRDEIRKLEAEDPSSRRPTV